MSNNTILRHVDPSANLQIFVLSPVEVQTETKLSNHKANIDTLLEVILLLSRNHNQIFLHEANQVHNDFVYLRINFIR